MLTPGWKIPWYCDARHGVRTDRHENHNHGPRALAHILLSLRRSQRSSWVGYAYDHDSDIEGNDYRADDVALKILGA